MKLIKKAASMIAIAALSFTAIASDKSDSVSPLKFVEDKHYAIHKNPRPELENTVVEWFWYGCPHCRRLEPLAQEWKTNKKPEHITFKTIPAAFNQVWANHAALYYTLDSLGLEKENRTEVFNLFATQLTSEQMMAWLESKGANQDSIAEAMNNPEYIERIKSDMSLSDHYNDVISGVPFILVHGKYYVNIAEFSDYSTVFDLVDYLISLEASKTEG